MQEEVDLQEFVTGFIAESEQLVATATARLLEIDEGNSRGELRPKAVRGLGLYIATEILRAQFCDWFAEQLHASACYVEAAYDGVTGIDLVQQLQPSRAPRLVAISAMQDDAHRSRSLACGFEAHLVKPIKPDALASVLKR